MVLAVGSTLTGPKARTTPTRISRCLSAGAAAELVLTPSSRPHLQVLS